MNFNFFLKYVVLSEIGLLNIFKEFEFSCNQINLIGSIWKDHNKLFH